MHPALLVLQRVARVLGASAGDKKNRPFIEDGVRGLLTRHKI